MCTRVLVCALTHMPVRVRVTCPCAPCVCTHALPCVVGVCPPVSAPERASAKALVTHGIGFTIEFSNNVFAVPRQGQFPAAPRWCLWFPVYQMVWGFTKSPACGGFFVIPRARPIVGFTSQLLLAPGSCPYQRWGLSTAGHQCDPPSGLSTSLVMVPILARSGFRCQLGSVPRGHGRFPNQAPTSRWVRCGVFRFCQLTESDSCTSLVLTPA